MILIHQSLVLLRGKDGKSDFVLPLALPATGIPRRRGSANVRVHSNVNVYITGGLMGFNGDEIEVSTKKGM